MSLFNNIIIKKDYNDQKFNKIDIINEILEKRNENCPEWKFFIIEKPNVKDDKIDNHLTFDVIKADFLAIYTALINKEIKFNGNPFSEYKRTIESIYQIVREVYIINDINNNINEYNNFKTITASSSKELFIKLKKEQG